MSRSIVRLELVNGLNRFHCPVCGHVVLSSREGTSEEMCSHIIFIENVIDELEYISTEHVHLFEEDDRDLEELAGKLPLASVIFHFEEPGRGGGHDSSSYRVCVDFQGSSEMDEADA